ncbi:hypothetical protein SASPL_132868 [Salvia splendens]|uniref:Myb/SANT-like domain-containing protein n=1 Tax=Salvia splendens TaxID=180675 RepID=A0A8X8ZHS4_SALSN|nr:uncharacterized protein At2g29880-like [Salvia splendens]KAG6405281.1 hypothetical protein SASPL_132868 [Salvia splendens]
MTDNYHPMNSVETNIGSQGGSGLGRGPRPRVDRTRRSWTAREEEILVSILKDLVTHGWKSDNGFRGGYLQRIEEALNREFPGCGLRVAPHINSKISQWKKSYSSLSAILARSGVGFNMNRDFKIDCDDDQWEQIVKCDANARGMRHRSWHLWDDWKVLFGKDRAVGTVAKDTFDAHDNYAGRTPSSQQDVRLGSPVESGEYSAANPSPQQRPMANPDESTGQSIDHSLQTKKSGSKRNASSPPVGLIEMLGRMQDDTNDRLDKLTNRIGFEFDLSEARKEVIDILSGVPDLTLVQQIDASEIIIDKVERVELFMRLPETSRLTYVMRVLEKHGHY